MGFEKAVCSKPALEEIVALFPFGPLVNYTDVSGVPNTTYLIYAESRQFLIRIYGKGQSSLAHILLEHELLVHLEQKGFRSPRLLRGRDGKMLFSWNGFYGCAFTFIPGMTADTLPITPAIAESVGESVASFGEAVADFPIGNVPLEETLLSRGELAMNQMGGALVDRGWLFDGPAVYAQWQAATRVLRSSCQAEQMGLLHADTWPPNIMCNGDEVVGILDYDDCCFGPRIVDIAIPLQEFALFQPDEKRHELAMAFVAGLGRRGEHLDAPDWSVLMACMEFMCSVWFAYNVIQSPRREDAELYYKRLEMLRNTGLTERLGELCNNAFERARRGGGRAKTFAG